MWSFFTRLGARPVRTVIGFSLVLFLSGNWILPLLDRDEPRFAEASREMLQRGDFVIPWFNGTYRFDKPPLIYWCQMACFQALGENAFAARLPSALFASATGVLLVLWGRRLNNEPAGFYAAIMFVSCLQVLIHARLSVADMPMIFFFTAAVWSGWELSHPDSERRAAWCGIFFASLGLGFLAKGPVVWLPLGVLLFASWRFPNLFQFRLSQLVPGLVLMFGIIGFWGIPALLKTHGEFFAVGVGRHVIHRSFGIMEGHGAKGLLGFVLAVPLYLLTFFPSFFPWSLRVPGALRAWWASRQSDVIGSYLLLQGGLVFAVFTLVRTKLPHYTLPAFPCLALWLGLRTAGTKKGATWLAKGLVGMSILTLVLTLGLFPLARARLVSTNVWQGAKPYVRPEMAMGVVQFGEPSLVWEFRKVVTNRVQMLSVSEAVSFLSQSPPRVLILPSAEFPESLRQLTSNAVMLRATGIDTVQFKCWDLTAVVKP
jgi:4-amino-4-deoxy-L-arabinose transferase-like glycosyltransferase